MLECGVLSAVLEHLLKIVVIIDNLVIEEDKADEEKRQAEEAAKENGVVFGVGHVERFNPAMDFSFLSAVAFKFRPPLGAFS